MAGQKLSDHRGTLSFRFFIECGKNKVLLITQFNLTCKQFNEPFSKQVAVSRRRKMYASKARLVYFFHFVFPSDQLKTVIIQSYSKLN